MSTFTPNMNLQLPTINVDSGLTWEQDVNANTNILDAHNHSAGNGVQIQPSGLNINGDLTFANNSATNLKALILTNQLSFATINSLYTIGGNLYFNDGSSNVIQVTSGGTVNATSSGITSGTATASFVSSVLVVNSAANTPANIQGGSILLGNNTPSSKFLTLAPPGAMAANFTITLPTLPGSALLMSIDSSGNIATGIANTVKTTDITNAAVTRPKLVAVGQQVSLSCGFFSTSSSSPVDVTNLSVTITTTGRPVMLLLISDGVGGDLGTFATTSASSSFYFLRDGSSISKQNVIAQGAVGSTISVLIPGSSVAFLDTGASAASHTYKVQVSANSSTTTIENLKLVAYEL